MNMLAAEFDTQMRGKAQELEDNLGVHIDFIDAFTLHQDILDEPDRFGFPNPEQQGGSLLFDDVHFRTTFQELLADRTAIALADFNDDGVLDADDVDALGVAGEDEVVFDLSFDGIVNQDDHRVWVKDLKQTWLGDSNLDGEFNSSDMVGVFKAGKYEVNTVAGWADGDWTADQRFDSGDLVAAFKDGGYEVGPLAAVSAVPEPSSMILLAMGVFSVSILLRRRLTK